MDLVCEMIMILEGVIDFDVLIGLGDDEFGRFLNWMCNDDE